MSMSVLASIRSQLAPVHREGLRFVGAFALMSLLLFWLWAPLGWLGSVATLWCAYFFRDPARVTPLRDGLVVAPADGRVSRVADAVPPSELELGERPLPRVSIFMSVFDCHVNRSPIAGVIERVIYHPGAFVSAEDRKSTRLNSSHITISYAVFCLKKKTINIAEKLEIVGRICLEKETPLLGDGRGRARGDIKPGFLEGEGIQTRRDQCHTILTRRL